MASRLDRGDEVWKMSVRLLISRYQLHWNCHLNYEVLLTSIKKPLKSCMRGTEKTGQWAGFYGFFTNFAVS